MNTPQKSSQARTLIAIDEQLVSSLQSTLEANRIEMEKLHQRVTGNEPMTLKDSAKYLHNSYNTLKEYMKNG